MFRNPAFSSNTCVYSSNKEASFVADRNREGKFNFEMENSRVSLYSFSEALKYSKYVKKNSENSLTYLNDTHNYIFQRKAIFENFMNKRVRLVMPGDFGLTSGFNVNLMMPPRAFKNDKRDDTDQTLTGNYTITSVRHIIKYNIHETVIDVATDSTEKPFAYQNNVLRQEQINTGR